MPLALWTDHRPRIEFYVRQGLVAKAPSDEQLARAFDAIRDKVGVLGQIKYYSKHPLMIFPTARKRAALRQNIAEMARERYEAPHEVPVDAAAQAGERPPLLDRSLERLFAFSPARFAAQCAFNPWAAIPSSGLNTPGNFLISHILHTTHPPPAIWDMQIVHADPGGLDELDARLERAMRSEGLRARIDRALGCREGYFDYLREWIPRVRRFEYPPIPRGLKPVAENLVEYLRYAAEL
jgi:hypothetical protein